MKKILKIFSVFLLVIVALFCVAGCTADTQSELQSKIDELQSRIEDLQSQNAEMQSQIEELEQELERKNDLLIENAKAGLYFFQQAYDMGFLSREDIMSIAYYHYDGRKYNEEIMAEDYTPQPKIPEEIDENMATKIKQAYLEQIARYPEGDKDLVHISYYYGTYNGNIVVSIPPAYIGIDPLIYEEFNLGGVLFKNFWPGGILVYHIN